MKSVFRIALRIACTVCVVVVVVMGGLRAYSGIGSVVAMAPLGGGRGLLFSSNWGGYCQLMWVEQWPGARLGVWAGEGWKRAGPFLSWWQFPGRQFKPGYRTAMVPLVSAGGPVAYEHGYARAEELGYPNRLAGPPDTVVIHARQIQFSHGLVIGIAAVLPVGVFFVRARAIRRVRLRRAAGLCVACGYDLRASPGVCPECGGAAELDGKRGPRRFPRWLSRGADVSLALCIATAVVWAASYRIGVMHDHRHGQVAGSLLVDEYKGFSIARGELWGRWGSNAMQLPAGLSPGTNAEFAALCAPAGIAETRWMRGAELRGEPGMGAFGGLSSWGGMRGPGDRSFVIGVRLYVIIALLAVWPGARWWWLGAGWRR